MFLISGERGKRGYINKLRKKGGVASSLKLKLLKITKKSLGDGGYQGYMPIFNKNSFLSKKTNNSKKNMRSKKKIFH